MANLETVLIVVSDLHFGQDLQQPSVVPSLKLAGRWKLLRPFWRFVRGEIQKSCASHDELILRKLAYELERICRQLPIDDYHQLILCGDLATIGDQASYQFQRRFLRRFTLHNNRMYGLGIRDHREKIVAVPGNHDKLFKNNLSSYSAHYGPRGNHKFYAPTQNGVYLVGRYLGQSVPFLFALFDSNHYRPPIDPFNPVASPLRTASGKIYASQLVLFRKKMQDLKQGNNVDDATPDQFTGTKICVMHHAPDMNFFGPKTWMLKGTSSSALFRQLIPHGCENVPLLFDALNEFGFDLVLSGHMHQSRVYRYQNIPVVGCSTTTQEQIASGKRARTKNSLYVLLFYDNRDVYAQCHVWDGSRFTLDPNPEVSRPINPW